MALDTATALRLYLVGAPENVYPIEVLSFSHSAMSRTRHVWRQPRAGQVADETGTLLDIECANVTVEIPGTPANLDQAATIALDTTDVEDEFRSEMDRVPIDTEEPVVIVYREYLSNDLLHPQASVTLEMVSISYQIGAAAVQAAAPKFNMNRTGEVYSPRDVPMLRAYL